LASVCADKVSRKLPAGRKDVEQQICDTGSRQTESKLTAMADPKYLSGDKEGLKEFISRFDVSHFLQHQNLRITGDSYFLMSTWK
jgi:hypothetical protein